jgi:hypothetical protein
VSTNNLYSHGILAQSIGGGGGSGGGEFGLFVSLGGGAPAVPASRFVSRTMAASRPVTRSPD